MKLKAFLEPIYKSYILVGKFSIFQCGKYHLDLVGNIWYASPCCWRRVVLVLVKNIDDIG